MQFKKNTNISFNIFRIVAYMAFHVKLESIITPGYLIEFSWFKFMPFKESVTLKGNFLCGGWKMTKLDLARNQVWILTN